MPYRVVMELLPRPDDTPQWVWDEINNSSSNVGVDTPFGGKAWTAKLSADDTIWEYDNEDDANTKMTELDNADSTNRRYKVIEV